MRAPQGKRQKPKLGNTVEEEPVGNERHNKGGTKGKGNGELNLIDNRKAPKKLNCFVACAPYRVFLLALFLK